MSTYDAIVAGAGPAGSTAARLLAGQGARVLLLDKARFPRDKELLGGGVKRLRLHMSSVRGYLRVDWLAK